MKRREHLQTAVAAALALAAPAGWTQANAPATRVMRLGVLGQRSPADPAAVPGWKFLADGLRALGWDEGRNLQVERRWGGYNAAQSLAAAQELVASGVDCIHTIDDATTFAAWSATRTIPIVMNGTAAVEPGYAKSLAQPGGNVTGVVWQVLDYVGKEWSLLRAMRPDLKRIGVPAGIGTSPIADLWLRTWQSTAGGQGASAVLLPNVAGLPDVEPMLAAAAREEVQALTLPTRLFLLGDGMRRINAWAIERRVLVSAGFARGQVLLAYGPHADLWVAAHAQIDRVLRGAKAADLPIHQPTRFELVVSQRIARAMGLAIPASVLVQATEVIE